MKNDCLQGFAALDDAAFGAFMRRLGFEQAACYRLTDQGFVQILGVPGSDPSIWPAAVGSFFHYTPETASGLPLGWVRNTDAPMGRKNWPKGALFYLPEQKFLETKLMFAVVTAPGKRCRTGELSGPLEACATRVRGWLEDVEGRAHANEEGVQEHLVTIAEDLQKLIDHELRTPLSSVAGYAALADHLDPAEDPGSWKEYHSVIAAQTRHALEAVEKLSLALAPADSARSSSVVDGVKEARELADSLERAAGEIVSSEAADALRIRFRVATDSVCNVKVDPRLYRMALWEVMKNAVTHARTGLVDLEAYCTDTMFVLDVYDDGRGVPSGSEDLIFLRFYQDPGSKGYRKGKRGLGLGLFLARDIVKRHMGHLLYVRGAGKRGCFRFLWPLSGEEDGNGSAEEPKKRA